MNYLLLILIAFFAVSCSQKTPVEDTKTISTAKNVKVEKNEKTITIEDTVPEPLTVMVIPCSNGYEYNAQMGDLNPSLEKYLAQDERIILKPFPLKQMRGTGYFGVFDKKHCGKILEKVDVDFLIMTRMRGLYVQPVHSDSGDWGYDTKILDVASMEQFNGISARKLKSFELIDADIKSKTDEMITLIIESRHE